MFDTKSKTSKVTGLIAIVIIILIKPIQTFGLFLRTELPFPFSLIGYIVGFLPLLSLLYVISMVVKTFKQDRLKAKSEDIAYATPQVVPMEQYHKKIPYEGEFIEIASLTKSNFYNVLFAYFSKWIMEGRLIDEIIETGLIRKKEKLALVFNPDGFAANLSETEAELWKMVIWASKADDVLSQDELFDYLYKEIYKINKWSNDINRKSYSFLKESGYYLTYQKSFLGILKYNDYALNEKGQILHNKVQGFKNYLKDFDKEYVGDIKDNKTAEKYLVWAIYLGYGLEFYELLKKHEPELVKNLFPKEDTFININNLTWSLSRKKDSINEAMNERSKKRNRRTQ